MQFPKEWVQIETKFDQNNLIFPKKRKQADLAKFCLSDYLVIQKWIDYGKGLGDPSTELFSELPIRYKGIYEAAKSRKFVDNDGD